MLTCYAHEAINPFCVFQARNERRHLDGFGAGAKRKQYSFIHIGPETSAVLWKRKRTRSLSI
jgi:hypothetical protein